MTVQCHVLFSLSESEQPLVRDIKRGQRTGRADRALLGR